DPQQVLVVDELGVRAGDLAVPLDVDRAAVVDHDLRDRVVAQERLQRTVAEDVVRDLPDDVLALLPRERRLLERQHLGHGLVDRGLEVVVAGARVGVEQTRAEPGDDVLMNAGLEVGEGIRDDRGALNSRLAWLLTRLGLGPVLPRDLNARLKRHGLSLPSELLATGA